MSTRITDTKTIPAAQIKAGSEHGLDEGIVEALISVYGVDDSYRQRVPGPESFKSYADVVNAGDVKTPVVWQHKIDDPWLYVGEVKSANPDGRGLKGEHGLALTMAFDIDESLGNPTALQAYKQVKGRRIPQWSYRWSGTATKAADGVDELSDVWVHEASPVLQGAVSQTHTLGTKAPAAVPPDSYVDDAGVLWVPYKMAEPTEDGGEKRAFTTEQRVALAKKGWAIPVRNDSGDIIDGRYPIENESDCRNAISAIGRVAEGDRAMVIAHIKRQARRLGMTDAIPDSWKSAVAVPGIELVALDIAALPAIPV